jgi:hypothetical protein
VPQPRTIEAKGRTVPGQRQRPEFSD